MAMSASLGLDEDDFDPDGAAAIALEPQSQPRQMQ
jgi:hypothetical protein